MLLIPDETSLVRVRVDTQKATRAALALEGKSLYNFVLSLYANPACAPSPKSFWDDGVWKALSPDLHKVSPTSRTCRRSPSLPTSSYSRRSSFRHPLRCGRPWAWPTPPWRASAPSPSSPTSTFSSVCSRRRALRLLQPSQTTRCRVPSLPPRPLQPPKTKKSKHASAAGGVRVVPASSPAPAVQRGSAAERGSADTPPSQRNSAASTPPTALATLLPTTRLRPGSVDPAVSQASFFRSLRMLDANASPLAIAAGQENGNALRAVLDVAKVLFPSLLQQEVELPNGEALSEGGAALFSYMNGLKPGMCAAPPTADKARAHCSPPLM